MGLGPVFCDKLSEGILAEIMTMYVYTLSFNFKNKKRKSESCKQNILLNSLSVLDLGQKSPKKQPFIHSFPY